MNAVSDSTLTPAGRLHILCESHNISRKELASRLGIAPSQVSRILNEDTKNINSDILIKIAREFHVWITFSGLNSRQTPSGMFRCA